MDDIIVGLDIGTTKVCAVIGELKEDRTINVLGAGSCSYTDGVKKGAIVDIKKTTEAIVYAIEEAEKSVDVSIDSVYVGIAGAHINSMNSKGAIAIKGANNEITSEDVDRAVDNAKTAVQISATHEIIHILPREFVVDEQNEISNPKGMVGSRLEAHVHIITGAVTAIKNLMKSCEMAKLNVEEVVLQQYASSLSALTEDERRLGVVLLDIGGGTTDIIVYKNGHVEYSSSIDIAGSSITNDIAFVLKTSTDKAEELKVNEGVAQIDLADEQITIDVPVAGGEKTKTITQTYLAEIIESRMEEIFAKAKTKIEEAVPLNSLPAGIVLTGGSSLLKGCTELAEGIFGIPVRTGNPIQISGIKEKVCKPQYSTALGLIRYGALNYREPTRESGFVSGIFEKIKNFFAKFFTD
ncbi:MAG: cell division protein FtsA [Candidatus Riflebacteria bacterium]|nr:cell division protein FtsA [Candidatus Riflebacteria bacterium]MBR4569483.1 cell division protein FtsA [Candidatus Riflebacteria bacterium]